MVNYSIYRKRPNQASLQTQKAAQWLQGGWGAPRGMEVMANGHGVPFWADENVLKFVVVMAA